MDSLRMSNPACWSYFTATSAAWWWSHTATTVSSRWKKGKRINAEKREKSRPYLPKIKDVARGRIAIAGCPPIRD